MVKITLNKDIKTISIEGKEITIFVRAKIFHISLTKMWNIV